MLYPAQSWRCPDSSPRSVWPGAQWLARTGRRFHTVVLERGSTHIRPAIKKLSSPLIDGCRVTVPEPVFLTVVTILVNRLPTKSLPKWASWSLRRIVFHAKNSQRRVAGSKGNLEFWRMVKEEVLVLVVFAGIGPKFTRSSRTMVLGQELTRVPRTTGAAGPLLIRSTVYVSSLCVFVAQTELCRW